MKADESICDTCENYYQSPSGCADGCWENMLGSHIIPYLNQHYYEQRRDGLKNHCKAYRKIQLNNLQRK